MTTAECKALNGVITPLETARARRRAEARARICRKACGWASGLFFLAMLGIVGGVERDTIGLLPGTISMFGSLGLSALFAWLAGAYK